jgi:hypothetical protein
MFFFASSGWILVKSEGSGVSFKILAHSGPDWRFLLEVLAG